MISKTVIENILIISAEFFWISSNFSQLLKLYKTKNNRGLFAPTQALNAAGNLAWITYFASKKLWVPLSTNAIMLALTVVTLSFLLSDKKQFAKGIVSIAIIGPLIALSIIVLPYFSGWVGVIFNTIAATPWLIHVMRTKRTSGISERSIILAVSAMVCTLNYGLLISSAPLIVGTVQGLIYMTVIGIYYYEYRDK